MRFLRLRVPSMPFARGSRLSSPSLTFWSIEVEVKSVAYSGRNRTSFASRMQSGFVCPTLIWSGKSVKRDEYSVRTPERHGTCNDMSVGDTACYRHGGQRLSSAGHELQWYKSAVHQTIFINVCLNPSSYTPSRRRDHVCENLSVEIKLRFARAKKVDYIIIARTFIYSSKQHRSQITSLLYRTNSKI